MGAALKLVPGANRLLPQVQADIDAAFPLTRPNWDFNTTEGKERLRVYSQILMGDLQEATSPQIYQR